MIELTKRIFTFVLMVAFVGPLVVGFYIGIVSGSSDYPLPPFYLQWIASCDEAYGFSFSSALSNGGCWFEYYLIVFFSAIAVVAPFTFYADYRKQSSVKELKESDFDPTDTKQKRFGLWLRPFFLDNNLKIAIRRTTLGKQNIKRDQMYKELLAGNVQWEDFYEEVQSYTPFDLYFLKDREKIYPISGGVDVSDDEWERYARRAIYFSRTIVFVPFDTPAMEWELNEITRGGYLSKVVVFFPVVEWDDLRFLKIKNYPEGAGPYKLLESGKQLMSRHGFEVPEFENGPVFVRYSLDKTVHMKLSLFDSTSSLERFFPQ